MDWQAFTLEVNPGRIRVRTLVYTDYSLSQDSGS